MRNILIFFLCTFLSTSIFATTKSFTNNIDSSIKVTPKTISDSNQKNYYKLNIKYPVLHGKEQGVQELNERIKKLIDTRIDSFKKEVNTNVPNLKNMPVAVRTSSLDITYDATVFKAENHLIASIRFNENTYHGGAAHPSTVNEVINYDLTKAHNLNLNELFKKDSQFLNVISDYVKPKLRQVVQNQDNEWFNKGTEPTTKNYDIWNLTPKGINFTFKEYQVAAYVYGRPEVLVPYQVLKTILDPNSAIAVCVKEDSCQ